MSLPLPCEVLGKILRAYYADPELSITTPMLTSSQFYRASQLCDLPIDISDRTAPSFALLLQQQPRYALFITHLRIRATLTRDIETILRLCPNLQRLELCAVDWKEQVSASFRLTLQNRIFHGCRPLEFLHLVSHEPIGHLATLRPRKGFQLPGWELWPVLNSSAPYFKKAVVSVVAPFPTPSYSYVRQKGSEAQLWPVGRPIAVLTGSPHMAVEDLRKMLAFLDHCSSASNAEQQIHFRIVTPDPAVGNWQVVAGESAETASTPVSVVGGSSVDGRWWRF